MRVLIAYVSTTFIIHTTMLGKGLTLSVRAHLGVLIANVTTAFLVFSTAFGQWFAITH